MKKVKKGVGAFAAILLLIGLPRAFAQWTIDVESGAVFSGYNDVEIPQETGTRFSLSEELETDPGYFIRLRLTRSFNDRHHISALVAPLRLDASGRIDRLVRFNEMEFAANAPLKARYRFDSYRLTYRYDFHRKDKLRAGIGLTAKIRDASISLEDEEQKTENKNTGFVPLVNFKVEWRFAEGFGLLLEGDALAAPQGRAEDVLLAVTYEPVKRATVRFGYRLLEGGADVDKVYTFALISYIVAGVTVRL
ncbi:MAG: hypothetical protein WBD64_05040 [Candidatus Zixiibacteriota bacterium]